MLLIIIIFIIIAVIINFITTAIIDVVNTIASTREVSLSLLVMPWKALPMALLLGPVAWAPRPHGRGERLLFGGTGKGYY